MQHAQSVTTAGTKLSKPRTKFAGTNYAYLVLSIWTPLLPESDNQNTFASGDSLLKQRCFLSQHRHFANMDFECRMSIMIDTQIQISCGLYKYVCCENVRVCVCVCVFGVCNCIIAVSVSVLCCSLIIFHVWACFTGKEYLLFLPMCIPGSGGVWKEKSEGMHAIVAGTAAWHHLLHRSLSLSLSQASIKALLRLYEGSIKALLRLYVGSIKAPWRLYVGDIKARRIEL